jgi:hypothetical protein
MKSIIWIPVAIGLTAAIAVTVAFGPGLAGKNRERANPKVNVVAKIQDPSGRPNTTTVYKTNYPMAPDISEALAKIWVDAARKKWQESKDAAE